MRTDIGTSVGFRLHIASVILHQVFQKFEQLSYLVDLNQPINIMMNILGVSSLLVFAIYRIVVTYSFDDL